MEEHSRGAQTQGDRGLREAIETYRQLRDELSRDHPLPADAMPVIVGPLSELFELLVEQPAGFFARREAMVRRIRQAWRESGAILDPERSEAVLDAISRVPRELFVSEEARELAYLPTPLSIGHEQTISSPLVVATLALAAGSNKNGCVLDVGTGCGYQAAVLSLLYNRVVSVEIIPELASAAAARLRRLGYTNIEVFEGDAVTAITDAQRFDAVVIAAGSSGIPLTLLQSLKIGGRLVAPVGPETGDEQLVCISRTSEREFVRGSLGPARFVSLQGVAARASRHENGSMTRLPYCFGAPILTTQSDTE
ncbi:protein-L-isoaspartate O-methyltransferase [uncultured Sphingomonas sp.]|uniref:protein-L-isoaspartate O-methyltransferase family protein n=1 Tax=uncultured Sphingomonas sp. TaxID=158754 RepID=UPI00261C3417|nr:protein-L-isoaspartate O-methyltransferase [uncultured Sphingomonas sp.]